MYLDKDKQILLLRHALSCDDKVKSIILEILDKAKPVDEGDIRLMDAYHYLDSKEISCRSYNCLMSLTRKPNKHEDSELRDIWYRKCEKRMGLQLNTLPVSSVGDLVDIGNRLLRLPNFGRKSYNEFREILARDGLSI